MRSARVNAPALRMHADARAFLPSVSIRKHRTGDEVTIVVADDLLVDFDEQLVVS
jgi:hypothetical protein